MACATRAVPAAESGLAVWRRGLEPRPRRERLRLCEFLPFLFGERFGRIGREGQAVRPAHLAHVLLRAGRRAARRCSHRRPRAPTRGRQSVCVCVRPKRDRRVKPPRPRDRHRHEVRGAPRPLGGAGASHSATASAMTSHPGGSGYAASLSVGCGLTCFSRTCACSGLSKMLGCMPHLSAGRRCAAKPAFETPAFPSLEATLKLSRLPPGTLSKLGAHRSWRWGSKSFWRSG